MERVERTRQLVLHETTGRTPPRHRILAMLYRKAAILAAVLFTPTAVAQEDLNVSVVFHLSPSALGSAAPPFFGRHRVPSCRSPPLTRRARLVTGRGVMPVH